LASLHQGCRWLRWRQRRVLQEDQRSTFHCWRIPHQNHRRLCHISQRHCSSCCHNVTPLHGAMSGVSGTAADLCAQMPPDQKTHTGHAHEGLWVQGCSTSCADASTLWLYISRDRPGATRNGVCWPHGRARCHAKSIGGQFSQTQVSSGACTVASNEPAACSA
jgi:hypothetical protein